MSDSAEMLLVSQNSATCAGDKDGDGEAIAYDNNHNRPGFDTLAVPVVRATSNPFAGTSTITVRASLITNQLSYGSSISVGPVSEYYRGDWVQVVQGPGIGQARKITAISAGESAAGPNVTFTVAPAFDVLPQSNSFVIDGRLFWQTYTVDNVVDQRTPPCLKSNRTRHAGGLITLYAATTDSAVEGNVQYDSSGILAEHQYELADHRAGIDAPGTLVQSFNEIRGNVISGRYDEHDKTPQAEYGLAIAYAATPNTLPPPTMSYGLAISHNLISRAGGSRGAVSLGPGWFTGPTSGIFHGLTPWKIADTTLIFKNTLTDMDRSAAPAVAIGISAANRAAPIEWRSVLYGNVCTGALAHSRSVADMGTATVRVCPAANAGSCSCDRPPTDLAVTGASDSIIGTAGQTVTYSIVVVNNGPGSATDATLLVEPSTGLVIKSMIGDGAACDTDDSNVNLCHLGTLEVGERVALAVAATTKGVTTASAIFSVTHGEADTNVKNDSVAITTIGLGADVPAPTDRQAH